MKENLAVLQKCPLFLQIDPQDITPLLGCLGGREVSFGKRETILSEGEPATRIGILLSGEAQIIQVDYFGNRSIIGSVAPSELFGESFACAGIDAMPVSVVASENSSVLFVDCSRVTKACCNACGFHQQIIYNLLHIVSAKNLVFHQKMEIASKRSTREKLMTYLLMQAKLRNSDRFEIPYDRQELADYLAVDRSGLSNEISKLCREGILENRRSYFRLLRGREEIL